MAIKNSIPQFDSSKTNLGTAPVDGFKANTIVKSDEVNRAIYDCSLSISALIKALINTNGALTTRDKEIDNSQSVDDIANTLSLMLGLGAKNAEIKIVESSSGSSSLYVGADGLTYNGLSLVLNSINIDRSIIGKDSLGQRVIYGFPFDSFLIKRKTFICTSLGTFNDKFINDYIPITAFFRFNSNDNNTYTDIGGKSVRIFASIGDIYPMYKQLEKVDGEYMFNYQNPSTLTGYPNGANTIMFNDDSGTGATTDNHIIPCPNTGTIYVVGISTSILN